MNIKTTATITLCVLGPILLPCLFGANLALTFIILGLSMLLGAWVLRATRTDDQPTEEEKELRKRLAFSEYHSRQAETDEEWAFWEKESRDLKEKLDALRGRS